MKKISFSIILLCFLSSIAAAGGKSNSWAERCAKALSRAKEIISPELVSSLSTTPINKNIELYFLVLDSNLKQFKELLKTNKVSLLNEEVLNTQTESAESYLQVMGSRKNLIALFNAIEVASQGNPLTYIWAGLDKNSNHKKQVTSNSNQKQMYVQRVMIEIQKSVSREEIVEKLKKFDFIIDVNYPSVPLGQDTYIIRGKINPEKIAQTESELAVKVWPDSEVELF